MRLNVLMPVYNGADTLPGTLRSVLAQTYGNFTFVIVDDGSDDGTGSLLEHAAREEPRIRVVRAGRNSGIVAALNLGIEHLDPDCDIVVRIDCGDTCRADRLERQAGYLEAHAECMVAGSRFETFCDTAELPDGIRRFEDFSNRLVAHEEIFDAFTVMSPLHHPTLAIRRRTFSDVGLYDEHYPAAEDYELIGRILTRGLRVAKIPEVLVRCRFAPGRGISQTRRVQQTKTALVVKLGFVLDNYLGKTAPRRCVIWGTRDFARYLAELLAERGSPLVPRCFTDFEPATWGSELCGLPVLEPDAMLASRRPGDVVITIWNREREAILAYLSANGWTRNRDLFVFS